MEYEKKDGKVVGKLKQKNVDTGAGLERITAVMQGKQTAYDTDLFENIIKKIKSLSRIENMKAQRIVADHIRTSVFMIADGVVPSNTSRGYVLRRLIRRAVRYSDVLKMFGDLTEIVKVIHDTYKDIYPEIANENYLRIVL